MPAKKKATAKKATPYADPKAKVAKGLIRVQKGRQFLDIAPAALAAHAVLGWEQVDAKEDDGDE